MQPAMLLAFLVAFYCIPRVVSNQTEYYGQYGINFNEDTNVEFLRYEHFDYDTIVSNHDSPECEKVRLLCYDYLQCGTKCEKLMPEWSSGPGQPTLYNPCVLMEMTCSGISEDDFAEHLEHLF